MSPIKIILFSLFTKVLLAVRDSLLPVPSFPLQFSAIITITAHLIEPESQYPPRIRSMLVYYDYIEKRARADISEGYEAAKTYIRRYDLKNEYMIRAPPINDCKRSYLGEMMPYPDIANSKFIGEETIGHFVCNYFLYEDFNTRIHIYMEKTNSFPVRLIQESTEDKLSTPLLTYDYEDVKLLPPDKSLFLVPSPYSHSQCDNHVGGFPYIHIFHHFAMF